MGRKTNEGKYTGLKQDKFRHSSFEMDDHELHPPENQISHAGLNTLNGPFEENRGRRGDHPRNHRFNDDTPFENGRITNWGHRQGWDIYFRRKSFRPGRHGGAIWGNDESNHTGRGPKGYQRSDESIFEDVCELLFLSPDVDASNIEVEVKNSCVFLKGSVTDRNSKKMAELEIENVSGLKDIQNMLIISGGDYVQEF